MLYKKKLVVNATVPMNRSVPVAANNKIQALIHKFGQPTPPVSISTGPDGTITIPATAFSSDVNSSAPASGRQHGLSTAPLYNAPFTVMPSWDAGAQVLSYPWNSTTDEGAATFTAPLHYFSRISQLALTSRRYANPMPCGVRYFYLVPVVCKLYSPQYLGHVANGC